MIINVLYRITSHKQTVEVDSVSTTPNKVSNQVLIFEDSLPDTDEMKQFLGNSSVGTVLVIDAFDKDEFKQFDCISGAESDLKIVKVQTINGKKAIYCLPANYLAFYIGQELEHESKIFTAKIVTLSDRAFRGIYADRSGPLVVEMLTNYFETINKQVDISSVIIPDNGQELEQILDSCKNENVDVLITTGGTGVSPRDITVETVRPFLSKEIPGVMEMIRVKYGAEKPNALLSCGVAGVMESTLVYTLPGSVKAVKEYLTEIFNTLDHLFYMIHGIDNH